jgi:hypothetical protein
LNHVRGRTINPQWAVAEPPGNIAQVA